MHFTVDTSEKYLSVMYGNSFPAMTSKPNSLNIHEYRLIYDVMLRTGINSKNQDKSCSTNMTKLEKTNYEKIAYEMSESVAKR